MLEDLEKVKSEVLNKVLEQLTNVNELVDDALAVPHLNSKNVLLKSIKETVKQSFDKFLIVSRMIKDMNFNEDINDLYCKSLMKQFGFNDPDSSDYDKTHNEAIKKLRKIRPFFTPISKQDYSALNGYSDDDDNISDANKSVNELCEEGMKEYGYEKNENGEWVNSLSNNAESESINSMESDVVNNKSNTETKKTSKRVRKSKAKKDN
jgi:hypothetical protein